MGTLFEAEVRTKNRINPEILAGEYQVRFGYQILQLADDGLEIEGQGHRVLIVKRPNFLPGDIFDMKLIDSGKGLIGNISGSMSTNQHKRIIGTIDLVLGKIIEYVHDHHEEFPEIERNSDFDRLSYDEYTKLSQIVQDSLRDSISTDSQALKRRSFGRRRKPKKATKGQLIAGLSICGALGLLTIGVNVLFGVIFFTLAVIFGISLGTGHYRK